jgi:thiosulfate reductase/polysulfide reductase chain A
MIQVIVTEELADCEFVKQYVVGCEDLPAAMSAYTPEWAAEITGVPAETIRRIAYEYAAAEHQALAHPGWRTSNFLNSFQTERAIATLNALSGNVLKPGGCLVAESPEAAGIGLGKPPQPAYPRATAARLDGVPWKYPLVPLKLGVFQELRDAILTGQPYQAHGWFISRQNPVNSLPDRPKTLQALGKLDCIVVVDVIMSDTAWFADIILPEAPYLERYDPLHISDGKVFIRQPVIEPVGESRSALWIYKELGARLGLADFFQYQDEEDYLQQQLAPLGFDLAALRRRGYVEPEREAAVGDEYTFNTPSGKIEVYSETLANAGFSPWPTWEAPPYPADDEFYLLTGKVGQHTQNATQNNELLHKYEDQPRVWIHTSTAASHGLKTDDLARLTSEIGSITSPVLVTEGIRSDCIFMAAGYGHISKGMRTAYGHGASDSDLHVTLTDPISGGQALTQTFVTIEKV